MNVLERRNAYLQTIAQLARERAAAKPIVETIGADVWDIEIPQEWRTAGFVLELTESASSILESDPKQSLALAQLALAIATSIPSDAYPSPIAAQIEGAAWKEIGMAHKAMSEYDAALRAFDAAQRAYDGAHALALESAIADFARAIVFVDVDRIAEALEILKKVEGVFQSFSDTRHLVQVKVLRGNIATQEHRWKDARAIYAEALTEVPLGDIHTRATLHLNLGVADTELGYFDAALVNLYAARQLFTESGMAIEANRCDWNVGRLLLQKHDYKTAATILAAVRTFFLAKSVSEEAGLAGLDEADAAIALGENDRARELVSQILAEFAAAKLNNRALTALAYLRDILPQTAKPAKAVRHVREYLHRLKDEPALIFLPLPE